MRLKFRLDNFCQPYQFCCLLFCIPFCAPGGRPTWRVNESLVIWFLNEYRQWGRQAGDWKEGGEEGEGGQGICSPRFLSSDHRGVSASLNHQSVSLLRFLVLLISPSPSPFRPRDIREPHLLLTPGCHTIPCGFPVCCPQLCE